MQRRITAVTITNQDASLLAHREQWIPMIIPGRHMRRGERSARMVLFILRDQKQRPTLLNGYSLVAKFLERLD
jgi:hypothetical protein